MKNINVSLKKITVSLLSLVVGLSSYANTTSVVLQPNSSTNIIVGGATITSFTLSASTNAAATVTLVDSPVWTNFTYVVPAYSNTLTVATNYVFFYTNYWGATTTLTNLAIIDITNNVVAASTNYYPNKFTTSALAGSTVPVGGISSRFVNGVQATNSTGSTATITIQYTQ